MDDILTSGLERMLQAVSEQPFPLVLVSQIPWPESVQAPPLPSVWQKDKHDFFEIAYVDKGACAITINNTAYLVPAGKLCIVTPGDLHYEAPAYSERDYRIYWLAVSTTRMKLHVTEYKSHQPSLTHLVSGVDTWLGCDLTAIFNKVVDEIRNSYSFSDVVTRGYLMSLLGLASRQLLAVAERGDVLQSEWRDPIINAVMKYVDLHYAEPDFGVSDMAAHVALSANYLSVYFRKVTGSSPYHYLLQTRMQHARQLLATSNLTVAEIAAAVGFTSPYHFSATFKRLNGVTPTAFRHDAGATPTIGTLNVS